MNTSRVGETRWRLEVYERALLRAHAAIVLAPLRVKPPSKRELRRLKWKRWLRRWRGGP